VQQPGETKEVKPEPKKAAPKKADRRAITSVSNIAKARAAKLAQLAAKKEAKKNVKEYVIQDSDSSSEEEEVVAPPPKKVKKAKKEKAAPVADNSALVAELAQIKAQMAANDKKLKKIKAKAKKGKVIQIPTETKQEAPKEKPKPQVSAHEKNSRLDW
jgi:hypothetical protein